METFDLISVADLAVDCSVVLLLEDMNRVCWETPGQCEAQFHGLRLQISCTESFQVP